MAMCIPINEPAFQDLSTLAPPYPLVSSPTKEFLSICYLGVCSSEYCLPLPSWPHKLSADPSTWVNFFPILKPLLPSPGHTDFFLSQRLLALIPDLTPHIRIASQATEHCGIRVTSQRLTMTGHIVAQIHSTARARTGLGSRRTPRPELLSSPHCLGWH